MLENLLWLKPWILFNWWKKNGITVGISNPVKKNSVNFCLVKEVIIWNLNLLIFLLDIDSLKKKFTGKPFLPVVGKANWNKLAWKVLDRNENSGSCYLPTCIGKNLWHYFQMWNFGQTIPTLLHFKEVDT